MYKHSTTHRTLSRRLAALLAALALLAAMALPVYAETQNEDTLQKTLLDVSEDTAIDTIDGTALAEVTKAEETRTDGENEASATDPAQDETAVDTEDTEDTAGESTAPAETNISDISDGTEDVNATQPTDDAENADAIDTQPAETADDEIALYGIGYPFYIYFAVPENFNGGYAVKFKARYGGGEKEWTGEEDMELVTDSTYSGRKVYRKQITQDMCQYGGFHTIQFRYYEGNTYKDQCETEYDWKEAENIANKLFDAQERKWVEYTPSDPTDHTAFSGKKMAFKNASTDELTNVVAHFYEKNEEGNLKEVATQELKNVSAGAKVEFTIPPKDKPCGFIQFTAGEPEKIISSIYNFYGQKVGTGEESFLYNEKTQFCFVYSTDSMAHWGTGEGRTIYYDATFSKLSVDTGYAIPSNVGGTVYYYLTGEGNEDKAGEMARQTNDLYSVDIEPGYDHIIFGAYKPTSATNVAGRGDSTENLEIPDANMYTSPCFYADTGDDSTYGGSGGTRGGYWAEVNTLRDAETNKKTGKTVVNVPQAEFKADSSTKYINTTLYDYYSDWELNGNNRDDYYAQFNTYDGGSNTFANDANAYRNWVTFRQFDQALSDYYQKDSTQNVLYPMYTGQFQPAAYDKNDGKLWGFGFAKVADSLNLYGYNETNKFMAVNNSTIDVSGGGLKATDPKYYDDAFQGLTGDNLVDGEPVLYNTKLTVPYFNKDFLLKSNSKNAKLGEVYDNVSFPFTKKPVFKEGNGSGVDYWYFDSKDTTLYLKKNNANNGYFLQKSEQSDERARSRNLKSNSNYQDGNATYGFFPFNEHSTDHQASTYNYGFGAKLKFQFTMNEDGQVYGTDGKTQVPIKFFFSGDDDVWVYIDDELALDVGGDHGKVSGLLEFGLNTQNELVYTPYVSDVKASNGKQMYTKDSTGKSVDYLEDGNTNPIKYKNIPFNYKGKEKSITPGTHTLTMYYMERGMWESNMAIAFNFPDHNELQVEKEVDLTNVNDIFKSCFQNRELFAFTIQNQATHYGTIAADDSTGKVQTKTVDLKSAKLTTANTDTGSGNIFAFDTDPDPGTTNTGQVLHWYAPYTDISSAHRDKRYGILTLEKPIDISNMKYLTFKLYVQSAKGQSTPSITNMYLELLDNQSPSKQKGGVNKASLSGTTYGVVTMAEDQWITVKLDLDKLTTEEGFNNLVKTIRFGCNYPRDIYLKDFTFTSAVPDVVHVGFTTKQDQIPDYGSATSGELKNATNARFTSSNKTKGTQVVDKDGKFLLADGETVTFTDQFRRGSYISLNEELNDKLFDTSWTLYENDVPVTTMAKGNKVEIPSPIPKLKDVNSSGPDDGRTENKGTDTEPTNKYSGQKPTTANTIVFRSYSNPDAEADTAFTKLKVKYVNKVKTGSLTIKKEAASGETLDGTYTFTVTFTNVGGLALESEGIPQTVEIQGTNAKTITGIPLGTRFRVEETGRNDSSHLQGVTVTNCDDGAVIDNKQVHGTITAREDNQITTVTFTNTKHELFDMTLTKQWRDADGKDLTTNLPEQIYVQLQRQKEGDTNWTEVKYPANSELDYVTITPDDGGWHYSFAGLDRTDVSDTTNNDKPKWKYRVVEGTLGSDGTFTPLAEGETILLNGNVYKVSGGEETTGKDNNTSATLTNTLQNPKFTLDVTKKSAENDGEKGQQKLLAGVEFTLEKMKDDDTGKLVVDGNFNKLTGVTNDKGELMLTGSNGEATATKGFKDLEAGTYRLTETKAAKDYNLLSEPITIIFSKDGKCKVGADVPTAAIPGTNYTGDAATGYTLNLTVLNRKTPALPHTGADAPSLWLLIGLPLAVAGLLILVFRYNKKGGRTR